MQLHATSAGMVCPAPSGKLKVLNGGDTGVWQPVANYRRPFIRRNRQQVRHARNRYPGLLPTAHQLEQRDLIGGGVSRRQPAVARRQRQPDRPRPDLQP